jgi:hypothetical protein
MSVLLDVNGQRVCIHGRRCWCRDPLLRRKIDACLQIDPCGENVPNPDLWHAHRIVELIFGTVVPGSLPRHHRRMP